MSKALNKKNLLGLGPERLADLLLEVTKGRADMQRRLRLELSAHVGPEDVAQDIRKRYASIRLAKGYLSRKTHRAFAKEVRSLVALIQQGVAPADPDLAFELLWELLHLGPTVLGRTKDTSDILAAAFGDVMVAVAAVTPNLNVPPQTVAEAVFEAVRHDASPVFAGAVAALAPFLGAVGLDHLKGLATAARGASRLQDRRLDTLLRDIADAQGDVDGYMARFTPAQLKQPAIAVDVAGRLLAAARAEDALPIIRTAMATSGTRMVEDMFIACLDALGRKDELRDFLWKSFVHRPDAGRLRGHLRLLPDFDDIDAEDRARELAQGHPDTHAALRFFVEWGDMAAAAALVQDRSGALDGGDPDLATCADRLEGRYPLASVLIRRAIILSLLRAGAVSADRRAADHLKTCAVADGAIPDYCDFPDHLSFLSKLRRLHGGRKAFWNLLV